MIKKSNQVIEASYSLSLAEQRIVLMSIANARKTGVGYRVGEKVLVWVDEYAKLYSIPPKEAYRQMKYACNRLRALSKITLKSTISDKSSQNDISCEGTVGWIDEEGVGVENNTQRKCVYVVFHRNVLPYLTQLDNRFTQYNIEYVAHMTSIYAIRMYEILIMDKRLKQLNPGDTGTKTLEVEWLRFYLDVIKKHTLMLNFKHRVLDPAVEQISKHSDLEVTYKGKKEGRNIVAFDFHYRVKDIAKDTYQKVSAPSNPPKSDPPKPNLNPPKSKPKSNLPKSNPLKSKIKLPINDNMRTDLKNLKSILGDREELEARKSEQDIQNSKILNEARFIAYQEFKNKGIEGSFEDFFNNLIS
jgi:plasmid replication initiation protein